MLCRKVRDSKNLIMNSNALHSFFVVLEKKPVIQWALLVFLFPFAFLFNLLYVSVLESVIRHVFNAININNLVDFNDDIFLIYITSVIYGLFSILLCLFVMRKKEFIRIWILPGFLFGGYTLFYCVIFFSANNFFKNYEGVLFWRFTNKTNTINIMKLIHTRIVYWLLFLLIICVIISLGLEYIYSIGLEVRRI